jgi:tRNA pseudouridine55 synthase
VNMATQRPRIPKRAVHGVLLFDKPLGLSSNDALQKVKRLYRAEKAGHTGTLDPLATGLLPLCFGAATKFSQISLEADKRYTATLKLGQTTDTGDAEGQVLRTREVTLSREQVEAVCQQFVGALEQVPPMYSALKREGRPLYEYARAGIEVERESRKITLRKVDILNWQHDQLVIDVVCTKGTYIRTLAQDIGEVLGCGAYLSALRRTGCGALTLNKSCTLAQLEAATPQERDVWLMATDALLADTPMVRLDAENAGRFLSGVRRRVDMRDEIQVRVYGPEDHAFLGSAHIKAGELISTRLLSPLEVQGLPQMPPFLTSKL